MQNRNAEFSDNRPSMHHPENEGFNRHPENPKQLDKVEARQGRRKGFVLKILIISTIGAALLMAIAALVIGN